MLLKEYLKRWLWSKKKVKVMPGTIINGNTTIGFNSYVGYNCIISWSTIGNYVSIANNVNIGHGEHLTDDISTNVFFYKDTNVLTQLPIVIEDDVWIGTGAIVLRGLKVGRGAIIGAGAVVTKDVPPYAIVVGIPAHVLRYRFEPHHILDIEKTRWWDRDVEEASKIIEKLREKIVE